MDRRGRKAKVLLLADNSRHHAATILDHIHALRRLSRHDVDLFNPVGAGGVRLPLQIYDAVVIHYSVIVIEPYYLSPSLYEQIAAYDGLKLQFIQDEYRWIDDITAAMADLGIHAVFTCAEPPEAQRLYGGVPGIEIVPTLTGYLPARLRNVRRMRLAERPLDVGYRGRAVPFWLGDLGQDKVRIATGFAAVAEQHGLVVDIDYLEERRIYGRHWDRFLDSCRTVLGTESGASIASWDRSVERLTAEYLAEHPAATFEEVSAAVLAPYEGNLRISVISPRVFEATAHGAALVQFPGRYSGIIEPWTHYIPLEKDFSNASEVVERIRDTAFIEELASRARRDLIESNAYGYDALARMFDAQVDAAERAPASVRFRTARATAAAGERRWNAVRIAAEFRIQSLRKSYLWFLKKRLVRRTLARQPAATILRRAMGSSAALRQLVLAFVFLRITATNRSLRRVIFVAVRTPRVRVMLVPGHGGLGDLLRLAVLVDSARRPARAGFRTSPRLDDDHRLTLISHGQDEWPSGEAPAVFSVNDVRELCWNHSAVGPLVSCHVFRSRRIHFTPGDAEDPYVRRFAIVQKLAQADPVATAAVLRSTLAR